MADRSHIVGHLKIETRTDQLDAEQLRDFEGGRAWELMRGKLHAMIASEQKTLETGTQVDDLRRAQGAIVSLRRVLDLPRIIKEEAAGKNK